MIFNFDRQGNSHLPTVAVIKPHWCRVRSEGRRFKCLILAGGLKCLILQEALRYEIPVLGSAFCPAEFGRSPTNDPDTADDPKAICPCYPRKR